MQEVCNWCMKEKPVRMVRYRDPKEAGKRICSNCWKNDRKNTEMGFHCDRCHRRNIILNESPLIPNREWCFSCIDEWDYWYWMDEEEFLLS